METSLQCNRSDNFLSGKLESYFQIFLDTDFLLPNFFFILIKIITQKVFINLLNHTFNSGVLV